MPLAITSSSQNLPSELPAGSAPTPKTAQEAQNILVKLRHYLAGKTGTLELVQKGDTFSLQRKGWWSFWRMSSSRNQEAATTYLKTVLAAAYPEKKTEGTHQTFNDYLTNTTNNQVSCADLKGQLKRLRGATVGMKSSLQKNLPTDHSLLIAESPEKDPVSAFLRNNGVSVTSDSLGEGGFGTVSAVHYKGTTDQYVYKKELKLVPLTKHDKRVNIEPGELDMERGDKFWRHGDVGAGLKLSNMVKAEFFIFKVETEPSSPKGSPVEYHYVPAAKTKEFGKNLMAVHPKANVYLHSQVMTRAPGKELFDLVNDGTVDFSPDQQNFKNVVHGLYNFLKTASSHNFLHRDLKLENCMLEPSTGEFHVIDTGMGQRLAKPEKTGEPKGKSNPKTSYRSAGTRAYFSPRVRGGEAHGSEVDCHSVAIILLALIDPVDFGAYCKKDDKVSNRFFRDAQFDDKPETYLKKYVTFASKDPKSTTAQVLKEHPDLKELIDLLFQAAAEGAPGKAAFEKLQDNLYLKSIIAEKAATSSNSVSTVTSPVTPTPPLEEVV